MNQNHVVIPGSFDPITNGHLDIIKRASVLYNSVTVLIGVNNEKRSFFSLSTRREMIDTAVSSLNNVVVESWEGLTIEYLKKHSLNILVRGVRNTIDYEIENQLAIMNKELYFECETVLLPASPNVSAVSSTVIRDLIKNDADVSKFVPNEIIGLIKGY